MTTQITRKITSSHFYQAYDRHALKQSPVTDYISGWRIDYMAFSRADTAHNPPVVILGGAFQSFNSYKYCIEPLLDNAPVILVDLPALGSNQQVANLDTGEPCHDLSMPALSKLLGEWVTMLELPHLSMMGMSLGSVVAANFAEQFADRLHRLVLMGVMRQTRKSWRMLIAESLHLLDANRMQEFGEAVVLYLVNHAKLEQTRMSGMARRLFLEQMAGFGDNEKARYRINAHRLLQVEQVPYPSCPTLVATGEYDSFTLPFENANFAHQCPHAAFAIIENADHVPQLQKRRQTLNLFVNFLKGESVAGLSGVRNLNQTEIATIERRGEPRLPMMQDKRLINAQDSSQCHDVMVHDVSFFGVLMVANSIEHAADIYALPRQLLLCLQDDQGDFNIPLLIFEQQGSKLRALFKHVSYQQAQRFKAYLENLEQDLALSTQAVS